MSNELNPAEMTQEQNTQEQEAQLEQHRKQEAIDDLAQAINSIESLHVHPGMTMVDSTEYIDIKSKLDEVIGVVGDEVQFLNLSATTVEDTSHLVLTVYVPQLDSEFDVPFVITDLSDDQSLGDCAQSTQAYIAHRKDGMPYIGLPNGMLIAFSSNTVSAFAEGIDKRFGIDKVTVTDHDDGTINIDTGEAVYALQVSDVELTAEIANQLREEMAAVPVNKAITKFLARGTQATTILLTNDQFETFIERLIAKDYVKINENLIVSKKSDTEVDAFIQWRDNENGTAIIEIKTGVLTEGLSARDILMAGLPSELLN